MGQKVESLIVDDGFQDAQFRSSVSVVEGEEVHVGGLSPRLHARVQQVKEGLGRARQHTTVSKQREVRREGGVLFPYTLFSICSWESACVLLADKSLPSSKKTACLGSVRSMNSLKSRASPEPTTMCSSP